MSTFYDSNVWHDFACGHPGGLEATRSLLASGGIKEGATVLDLACGTGDSVALLAELGMKPLGLDRPAVLERAKQKHASLPDQSWQPWQDDPWAPLPCPDASVDAVLCECSFSLFRHPDAVLREMQRVLRPHGVLLLSDVSTGKPFDLDGFKRLSWQDETAQLKVFIARWIWETGTAFPATCNGTHYFSGVYQKTRGME